jgi:hypothetical protein
MHLGLEQSLVFYLEVICAQIILRWQEQLKVLIVEQISGLSRLTYL